MKPSCHRSSRAGQAAILLTMSLVVTLGLLGLVVDIGWAYWRREAAKTAADSAAMAAVMAVSTSTLTTCNANGVTCQNDTACPASPVSPPTNNIGNGCLYAQKNGFVNSGKQTVTIQAHGPDNISPAGLNLTPTYWVTATVSEVIPVTFSAILGQKNATVAARGTAAIFQKPSANCIYALDPNADIGVDASGNPDVESSCGIYINSSASNALSVGGSKAVVNVSNGGTINIVGSYSTNGHPTISPSPLVNQSPAADPFADVPPVTPPAGHATCDSTTDLSSGNIVMPADGYFVDCGGGFSMSGNPTVNLPPGIYIMNGGSIALHNGTLTGSGVTFYLTGLFSGITIDGNVNVNLSAPTSGPTKGLIFYQDRSLAVGAFSTTINGGSTTLFNGSLYFPTTNITYSGGANTTNTYTAIVAWQIAFRGTSNFAKDTNGVHTGIGTPTIAFIQ